jgi:cytochrome c6
MEMKKVLTGTAAFCIVALTAAAALADTPKGGKIDGRKEFDEHCVVCHANGGNIINKAKTLSKKDRETNGVKSVKDIVAKIRKPGPGMTAFDKNTISDKEAAEIAKYIIKTFK